LDRIEVKNQSNADLIIEDIGVRLSAGSSTTIDSKLLEISKDFRIHPLKKFIKITKIMTMKAPIWPFIPKLPAIDEKAKKKEKEETIPYQSDSNISNELLDKLNDTMNQILKHLQKPQHQQYILTKPLEVKDEISSNNEEPLFIPTRILPLEDTGARINIKSDEMSKSDKSSFDSSKEYLKALRKDHKPK